jgi:hypothetical protein
MIRFYRLAGMVAAIGCGAYFIAVGFEHASAFPALRWDASAFAGVTLAVVLFFATMVIAGFAWYVVLRASGDQPQLSAAMMTIMLSQFAKYLPGNFAHVIGRVMLARSYGCSMPRVIFAMTFETGWVIAAAVAVSVIALLVGEAGHLAALPDFGGAWFAAALAVVAIGVPAIGAWSLKRWRPRPLTKLLGDTSVSLPGIAPTIICFALYCGGFIVAGAALEFLAQGLFGTGESRFALMTGVFALAWVAGYITPGAPAGLGVREAVLLAVLGPIQGAETAVSIAVVLRACTLAADGIGFLVGLVIQRWVRSG